jgi:predicted aspartyl protease
MPTYDSAQFAPPAPVATVSLRAPNNDNNAVDVQMLIDTGADLTLVPERCIADLKVNADQSEGYELEGFDGSKTIAPTVQLDLTLLRRTFRGRFVVTDSQRGILGRNVLNHFAILLDGPGLNWQELADSSK